MIYSIKRFSEDGEKKSHTLRNTLLGAAAIGGGIAAGRAGMLGSGVQRAIGRGTVSLGKMTGNRSLMKDGIQTYRKGEAGKAGLAAVGKATQGTQNLMNNSGVGDILDKTPIAS